MNNTKKSLFFVLASVLLIGANCTPEAKNTSYTWVNADTVSVGAVTYTISIGSTNTGNINPYPFITGSANNNAYIYGTDFQFGIEISNSSTGQDPHYALLLEYNGDTRLLLGSGSYYFSSTINSITNLTATIVYGVVRPIGPEREEVFYTNVASKSYQIYQDSTAPSLSSLSLSDAYAKLNGSTYLCKNNSNVDFSISASDSGSGIKSVSLYLYTDTAGVNYYNSYNMSLSAGKYSKTSLPLNQNNCRSFRIIATDNVGRTSQVFYRVDYDTDAPLWTGSAILGVPKISNSGNSLSFRINPASDGAGVGAITYDFKVIVDGLNGQPHPLNNQQYNAAGYSFDIADTPLNRNPHAIFLISCIAKDKYDNNSEAKIVEYELPPLATIEGDNTFLDDAVHFVEVEAFEEKPDSQYVIGYELFCNSLSTYARIKIPASDVAGTDGRFSLNDSFPVQKAVAHKITYQLKTTTALESQSAIPSTNGTRTIDLQNYRSPIGFRLNVGDAVTTIAADGTMTTTDSRVMDGTIWFNVNNATIGVMPFYESNVISQGKDIEGDNVFYEVHFFNEQGEESEYENGIETGTSISIAKDGIYSGYLKLKDTWTVNSETTSEEWNVEHDGHPALITLKVDRNFPIIGSIISRDRTKDSDLPITFSGLSDATSGVADLVLWNGITRPAVTSIVEVTEPSIELTGLTTAEIDEVRAGTRAIRLRFPEAEVETEVQVLWTLTAAAAGVDEQKTMSAVVVDLAGNESEVSQYNVVYDTKPTSVPHLQNYGFGDVAGHPIVVSWDAVAGVYEYRVEYKAVGAGEYKLVPLASTATTVSIPTTGLEEDTAVDVRVVALDEAGNEAATSIVAHSYVLPGVATGSQYYAMDGASAVRSYRFETTGAGVQAIERYEGGQTWSELGTMIDGQWADTGFAAHAIRTYRVVSKTSDGTRCGATEPFVYPLSDALADYPVEAAKLAQTPPYITPHSTVSWLPAFDPDGDPISYTVLVLNAAMPGDYEVAGIIDDESTAWSLSEYEFEQGAQYNWKVVASAYGKNVESDIGSFTVDGVGPVVSIENLPDSYYTNIESINVTVLDAVAGGEAIARASQVGTTVDLTATSLGGGHFAIDLSNLPEGVTQIVVIGRDSAGNETSLAPAVVRIDRTAPQVASVSFDSAASSGSTVPVTLGLADSRSGIFGIEYGWSSSQANPPTAWSSMRVETQASLNGTGWTRSYVRSLSSIGAGSQGSYLFVKAVDWAGNESTVAVSSGSLILDISPPLASLTVTGLVRKGSAAYATSVNAIQATLAHSDDESGSSAAYAVEVEGSSIEWFGTWADARTSVDFIDGHRYRIIAKATNGTGASATEYGAWFTFDATVPSDFNFTVSGTPVIPGASVRIVAHANDQGSGIDRLGLAIGTSAGNTELSSLLPGAESGYIWKDAGSGEAVFTFALPSNATGSYYVTLVAEDRAGLRSSQSYESPAFSTAAVGGMVVRDQGPYTSETNSLMGHWAYTGPESVSGYRYRVSGSDGSNTSWQSTTETELRISGLSLTNGVTYRIQALAILSEGGESGIGQSLGVLVDDSAPVISSFSAPIACRSDNFALTWISTDEESGIGRVEFLLETRNAEGISTPLGGGWRDIGALANGVAVPIVLESDEGTNILTHGMRVYASIRVTNRAGEPVEASAQVTIIDDTPPPSPVVLDQGDSINLTQAQAGLSASWLWGEEDFESGIVSYSWAMSTSRAGLTAATWHEVGLGRSLSSGPLSVAHGDIVYFGVRATNAAGLTSEGISNGIVCDETAPFVADVRLTKVGDGADVHYLANDADLKLAIQAYEDYSQIVVYEGYLGTIDGTGEWHEIGERRWKGTESTIDLGLDPIPEDAGMVVFRGETVNSIGDRQYGLTTGVIVDSGVPEITGVFGSASSSGLAFDWTALSSGAPITRFEIQLAEAGNGLSPAAWLNVGLTTRYAVLADALSDGRFVLYVKAVSATGSWSEVASSAIVSYDSTPPEIQSLHCPDYASHGLDFTIEASDSLSGIREYQYALGSADDSTLYSGGWNSMITRSGSYTGSFSFSELQAPVKDGERVYLMVRVKNGAGLWSGIASSDRIIVDMSAPTKPTVGVAAYSRYLDRIESAAIATIDAESGITHLSYGAVAAGESEPEEWGIIAVDGFIPELELTNATLPGLDLVDGNSYKVAIRAKNGAGDWSETGYSGSIVADATAPALFFAESSSTIVVNSGVRAIEYWTDEDCTVQLTLMRPSGAVSTVATVIVEAGTHYTYYFDETFAGIYRLSGSALDSAGNVGNIGSAAVTQRIRLNAAPLITISSEFATRPGAPLQLRAIVIDPDADQTPGATISYAWTGETQLPSAIAEPEWRYYHRADWDQRSEYQVTLTVTDVDGKSASETSTVVVENTRFGTLYVNEFWKGQHELRGDVIVPAGTDLSIESGALVLAVGNEITGWDHELRIEGALYAQGAVFEERDSGKLWSGIIVTGHASLSNARISGAGRGLTVLPNAIVNLQGMTLSGNAIGLHAYGSELNATNVRVIGNSLYGIKEDAGAHVAVKDSTFGDNGNDYYDEDLTTVSLEELNDLPGNSGNSEE